MRDWIIETKHLTKKYGNQTAVRDVNLHVEKGHIYGLLGRNGAGKTTIMKMILGLTSMTSGSAEVFGKNIKGNEKRIYPRIGAMIEAPGFYPNLTGTENLEIFAKLRGTSAPDAVKKALEVVGLLYRDKKIFSKYSLGMKQRLGIANAILHDPEVLILDEPTNGLDPIGIAKMREFIKKLSTEKGKTILISSHILSEIALLADDIGIIDKGVLLEESSMEELEKKNRKYILLQVSDIPKTILVLERRFQVKDYSVQDEQTIRIYDTELNMGELNKALVMPFFAFLYFGYLGKKNIEPVLFYKWSAFGFTLFLILPFILGLLSIMLLHDENRYDMLKQLWIVPVSKAGYFFGKFFMVFLYSLCFMMINAAASVLFSVIPNYVAFDWRSIAFLVERCLEIAGLTAFAILPVFAVTVSQKGYIFPMCITLIYIFAGFFITPVNSYLHPLSCISVIISRGGVIPGVALLEPNLPLAFFSMCVWGIASVVLAVATLGKRK